MSESDKTKEIKQSKVGKVVWHDLTIPNADKVKDFYKSVIGWEHQAFNMGDYEDYILVPKGSKTDAVGVCWNRGSNKNIPPVWMTYIGVSSVENSVKTVTELGGKILDGPRMMDGKNFAVIEDPEGAILAIIDVE